MSEHTYDLERDLKEAEEMAKSLVPYVDQETLYGSVGGFGFISKRNMPSLTIGALLLRIRRLQALADEGRLDDKQQKRLDDLIRRHDEVYKQHQRNYETKLQREAASRLKSMRHYFEECDRDPRLCADTYRPEAIKRTIVQEVLRRMRELGLEPDEDLSPLRATMDARLKRVAVDTEAGFLLDEVLQPIYPHETYWWLYRRPRGEGK